LALDERHVFIPQTSHLVTFARSRSFCYRDFMDYHLLPSASEMSALQADDARAFERAWKGDLDRPRQLFHQDRTLAMEAIDLGALRCLGLLANHGADLHAVDHRSQSLIYLAAKRAAERKELGCLRFLLERSVSPDALSPSCEPLIGFMARQGSVDALNLLLEFGADITETDSRGHDPLVLAAFEGHNDCVELLSRHDPEGDLLYDLAIHAASVRAHPKCAALIQSLNEARILDGASSQPAPAQKLRVRI
jgi:hypothetical protein